MGYLTHKYFRMSYVWNIHKYLYQGYSMDILFQSARGPCRLESLAAPSGPGPLSTILCHCYAQLLSLSHLQAP